jgi:hypothetical protein
MDFKVVCMNDKAMPKDFPAKYWIKRGEMYTVIDAKEMYYNRKSLGYKLEEIDIPADCKYQYFLANRFAQISEEELEMAMNELLEEINEIVPEVQGVVGQRTVITCRSFLQAALLAPES